MQIVGLGVQLAHKSPRRTLRREGKLPMCQVASFPVGWQSWQVNVEINNVHDYIAHHDCGREVGAHSKPAILAPPHPHRRVRHPLKFTLRPDLGCSIPMAIA